MRASLEIVLAHANKVTTLYTQMSIMIWNQNYITFFIHFKYLHFALAIVFKYSSIYLIIFSLLTKHLLSFLRKLFNEKRITLFQKIYKKYSSFLVFTVNREKPISIEYNEVEIYWRGIIKELSETNNSFSSLSTQSMITATGIGT